MQMKKSVRVVNTQFFMIVAKSFAAAKYLEKKKEIFYMVNAHLKRKKNHDPLRMRTEEVGIK